MKMDQTEVAKEEIWQQAYNTIVSNNEEPDSKKESENVPALLPMDCICRKQEKNVRESK